MNTAFDILVIILSATLAIFLILSIIAVSMVLKLLSSLRKVVAKGEYLVDSAEELTETLRRNAGAVSLVKLLMKFVATNSKKGK
jgi:biopolymer transport protein ExbB/TolQ